jgi:hypothetical protein
VVKIPAKKGQYRMAALPFKNLSGIDLKMEVEMVSMNDNEEKAYDVVAQSYITAEKKSIFFVNMQLKENINYRGEYPSRMTIRKVLLLKIKNSSCIFYFAIEVNIFEGQVMENN